MSDSVNNYFFAIAAATPLPSVEGQDPINNANPAPPLPRTRSQVSALRSPFTVRPTVLSAPVAKKSSTKPNKKRKPEFTIFVDTEAANDIPRPIQTPKRSKTNSLRTPLGDRTFSTASTPSPSPRLPDTPFRFSPADPLWENTENYEPYIETPPTTPLGPPSTPLGPTASVGPPPPLSTRALRPRRDRASSLANLLPPVNMLAYNMLGLQNWRISSIGINLAYRKVASRTHPDMVAPAQKELATLDMQQINAVKDMLMDKDLRIKYHRDGLIPWVV
ncbi:hypothetical protein J4E86_005829 [Alternaria arbusti]|uniref:uncharacterized protein n=1 Tax=Alternaria arbusti TaxID=232088 RepID=UPI00221FB5E4|nr:uncharacterized protein J4E86_005829 [Alternaria arbusti]KAI4954520.1 hypothetical protein J4E86_005829 [Alternaria arbusti]